MQEEVDDALGRLRLAYDEMQRFIAGSGLDPVPDTSDGITDIPPSAFTTAPMPRLITHRDSYCNREWVRTQLARFTYKPTWKFELDIFMPLGRRGFADIWINVSCEVEDTYHPGHKIRVGGSHLVYVDGRNEDLFARQLVGAIQSLEIHESREWLHRDGTIWDNPHKN
jgi:hypothetical protein